MDIQEVEDSLQSAFTALTDIMLLVGGVAASSVILSLRMKNELYEAKEEQEPGAVLRPPHVAHSEQLEAQQDFDGDAAAFSEGEMDDDNDAGPPGAASRAMASRKSR